MTAKVVNRKASRFLFCVVVIFTVFSPSVHVCSAVDKAAADEALGLAEEDLRSAFISVREAEEVGAGVEGLLLKLEISGEALAQAYSAYIRSDFESACTFATSSSGGLTGVIDEAQMLKIDAEKAFSERLFWTAGISSICLCVLLVASLLGWRLVKGRFIKQVLKSRPELVKSNESG